MNYAKYLLYFLFFYGSFFCFIAFSDPKLYAVLVMSFVFVSLLALKSGNSSENSVVWKNAQQESPTAAGDYLCYVKETSDLGIAFYQDIFFYSKDMNRWATTNGKKLEVLHWTQISNP